MSFQLDIKNIEQFKVIKFSEENCYYGELIWVDPSGKTIEDLTEIPEEEQTKLIRVRHGNGIQIYGKSPYGETVRYEGQWDHDKRSGYGKCIYPDGSYYIGEYQRNEMDGTGTFNWKDGAVYKGEWVAGKMSGQGEYKSPFNIVFKGTFINGLYLDVGIL